MNQVSEVGVFFDNFCFFFSQIRGSPLMTSCAKGEGGLRKRDVCQIFDDKGGGGVSQKVTLHDISRGQTWNK